MSAFWFEWPLSVDRPGRRAASRSKRARQTNLATIEVRALEARRLLSALTISLETTSDTGLSNSDRITQDNNGPNGVYPAPVFDVTGISPGIELNLYRIDLGVSRLVNSLSIANVPQSQTTVSIADINFGPNHSPGPPIPDGTYTYDATMMYLTGQVLTTLGIQVTILATAPPAPLAPVLVPASDSGAIGDGITDITDPTFDVDSVAPKSTVTLFRDGVFITSVTSAGGGTVSIQDAGPVPLGAHSYQAEQTDVTGNVSPMSSATPVTIVSQTTNPLPPAPEAPVLDPASESGDEGPHQTDVTTPIFDIHSVALRHGQALARRRDGRFGCRRGLVRYDSGSRTIHTRERCVPVRTLLLCSRTDRPGGQCQSNVSGDAARHCRGPANLARARPRFRYGNPGR